MYFPQNVVFLLIAVVFIIGHTAAQPRWNYPNLEKHEKFPKWGGYCDNGTNQTPINLSYKTSFSRKFKSLHFVNYNKKQTGVVVVNNGRTIKFSQFPHKMVLRGGPLLDDYIVEQIHLHWRSEHTIDNYHYPLEVHIVHRNKRYPDMSVAGTAKNGVAVLGVLYTASNKHNAAIGKITDILDELKSYKAINIPVKMKNAFVARDLVPTVNGYFTYSGSLSTPPCSEVVIWIVLHTTFPVNLEQVEKLREIEYAEGKQLRNNFRRIQKTNNRLVNVQLPKNYKPQFWNAGVSLQVLSLSTILIMASLAKCLVNAIQIY